MRIKDNLWVGVQAVWMRVYGPEAAPSHAVAQVSRQPSGPLPALAPPPVAPVNTTSNDTRPSASKAGPDTLVSDLSAGVRTPSTTRSYSKPPSRTSFDSCELPDRSRFQTQLDLCKAVFRVPMAVIALLPEGRWGRFGAACREAGLACERMVRRDTIGARRCVLRHAPLQSWNGVDRWRGWDSARSLPRASRRRSCTTSGSWPRPPPPNASWYARDMDFWMQRLCAAAM